MTKRRCPKCGRHKIPNQFKRTDAEGWCRTCRKNVTHGSYNGPVADPTVISSGKELELGRGHVMVIQRIGDAVRITTARREERTVTPSLVIGATLLLPLRHLPVVLQAVRKAATEE